MKIKNMTKKKINMLAKTCKYPEVRREIIYCWLSYDKTDREVNHKSILTEGELQRKKITYFHILFSQEFKCYYLEWLTEGPSP